MIQVSYIFGTVQGTHIILTYIGLINSPRIVLATQSCIQHEAIFCYFKQIYLATINCREQQFIDKNKFKQGATLAILLVIPTFIYYRYILISI